MDVFDRIASWISENESLFSGLAAIVALVAIVPAALRPIWRARGTDLRESARAESDSSTASDERASPRLAVMPIEAIGGDDDLVGTAEILTGELTALLARSRGCEVISRRSSTAFAAAGGTSREAGRTLDVRYVVEGELRSAKAGFRIGATLIDTARDGVVWSDAFETGDEDVDRVARSLAERVASHLGIELTRAEVGRVRRRPASREARDLVLRAQGVLFDGGYSQETSERAVALLEQAIASDPDYAEAHGQLALLSALGSIFGFHSADVDGESRALEACRRAIEIDDRSSEVLGSVGCAYCDLRRYDQGLALLERAIELNPSNAQAKAALGTALLGLHRTEEAVEKLEEAMRLTPVHKGIAPWATVLTGAYLRLGRLDDAAESIEQAMRCDPSFYPAHLAAALLALARADRPAAEHHVREARRLYPNLNATTIGRISGEKAAEILMPLFEMEAGGS